MAKEIMEKSKQDLIRATKSNNINIDYIARAYIVLSDIYIFNEDLQNADASIKKALRAKRKIIGGLDRMRNINKIKLTSMENL